MSLSITRVNYDSVSGAGSSSNYSVTINCPAGCLIVVSARWEEDDVTPTCSDDVGNTYVLAADLQNTGEAHGLAVFYCLSNASLDATNLITISYGSSQSYHVVFAVSYSYTGTIDTPSIETKTSTANESSEYSTGQAVTSAAGDLVFFATSTYNDNNIVTQNNSFTGLDDSEWAATADFIGALSAVTPIMDGLTDSFNACTVHFFEATSGSIIPQIMHNRRMLLG